MKKSASRISHSKPILFSGIQPTGRLHIGNYLGALKNFVALQNSGEYRCIYAIVDLHSLTEEFAPEEKRGQILELTADMLAAGLDAKKSIIIQQSQIPAHSELTWILNTITPMGELERMTQYKDKSGDQKENSNVGLFDYPVLMAADIILYDTAFVPVGNDQDQHLELTRTLVRKFNAKFPALRSHGEGGGETFREPKALHTPTPRIMSLDDPGRKMSKSRPAGCLFMDDSPEEIEKKLKRAVTDSGSDIQYDPKKKPAISNLLDIYSGITGASIAGLEKKFAGRGYGEFKMALAKDIADHFAPFRAKKEKLLVNRTSLIAILKKGSATAHKIASKKILEVRKKIGLTV